MTLQEESIILSIDFINGIKTNNLQLIKNIQSDVERIVKDGGLTGFNSVPLMELFYEFNGNDAMNWIIDNYDMDIHSLYLCRVESYLNRIITTRTSDEITEWINSQLIYRDSYLNLPKEYFNILLYKVMIQNKNFDMLSQLKDSIVGE